MGILSNLSFANINRVWKYLERLMVDTKKKARITGTMGISFISTTNRITGEESIIVFAEANGSESVCEAYRKSIATIKESEMNGKRIFQVGRIIKNRMKKCIQAKYNENSQLKLFADYL